MSKIGSTTQAGILLLGPGGLRANSIMSNLMSLTPEQQESVSKAKKYAMEQSIKGIMMKQVLTSQQQQQKSIQRHQALVLMCRVYVGSISFELKEETIKAAFAPFGAIKSISMSWDPVTLKHKGFAFVEYELPEAAQLALEHMNGIQLGGRQIKVGRPSNMPQAAPVIHQIQEECKERNRVYVSNVHPDLFEPELANIFDPFGKVRSCKLAMTPDVEKPLHRGYGFIEFETEAAAIEALTMDSFDLGGAVLHVCRATTPAENLSSYGTLESGGGSQTSMSTNPSSEEDIQLQLERANKEQERIASGDIEPYTAKPDETTSPAVKVSPETSSYLNTNGLANDETRISNVIVLRNMVTADDDMDDALQLDVYEECSKYGTITQVVIYVDKKAVEHTNGKDVEQDSDKDRNVNTVRIFVKYKDSTGSRRAREALNGRFFGGRRVSAEHYDRESFRLSDYSQ